MDINTIIERDTWAALSNNTSGREMNNEAVDISVLTSFDDVHVNGEPDLVVELIDLYLEDLPQRLKSMRDALKLGDAVSLRGTAHSLKGSSSSLGALQMAALCDELESSVNVSSPHGVNSKLTRVEQEFERVRVAFTAERDRRLS
jgi:HPt (histidine-containing phosphotransfer) domain-containing protein